MVRDDNVGWIYSDAHIGPDGHVGRGQGGWEDGGASSWAVVDANLVNGNGEGPFPLPSSSNCTFNVDYLLRLQRFYAVVNPRKIPGEQCARMQERKKS